MSSICLLDKVSLGSDRLYSRGGLEEPSVPPNLPAVGWQGQVAFRLPRHYALLAHPLPRSKEERGAAGGGATRATYPSEPTRRKGLALTLSACRGEAKWVRISFNDEDNTSLDRPHSLELVDGHV